MDPASGGPSERPIPGCRHAHERPRVLRITTRFRGSDHADDLIRSTEALRARGFDTRLVWGGSKDATVAEDPPPGIAHTYLPWLGQELHPGDDLRAVIAIAGIVRRWKPDVVHTHLSKAGALGRLVAIRAKVPVVIHTFHDRAWRDDRSALRSAAFITVERRLADRTDALTTGSALMRDELLELGIGRPARFHVVAAGEDPSDLVQLYERLLERSFARRSSLASPPAAHPQRSASPALPGV
jgi:Glycosyl transferase 4-like domain